MSDTERDINNQSIHHGAKDRATVHLSVPELKQLIIVELERLGLYCDAAVTLMLMIAAHESGGFFYTRAAEGKRLSYWQISQACHDEVLQYLREQKTTLLPYLESINRDLDGAELETNLRYAVCIARLRLFMLSAPLPEADNLVGMAQYANTYWNSHHGVATPDNYLHAYQDYCQLTGQAIPN